MHLELVNAQFLYLLCDLHRIVILRDKAHGDTEQWHIRVPGDQSFLERVPKEQEVRVEH